MWLFLAFVKRKQQQRQSVFILGIFGQLKNNAAVPFENIGA
jgi:hypothetical protein